MQVYVPDTAKFLEMFVMPTVLCVQLLFRCCLPCLSFLFPFVFIANSLVCWHACFLFFARMLDAFGIAWSNHLAVFAFAVCFSGSY